MEIDRLFAERVKTLKGSTIREILKLVNQPDMISFAGGVPAPESYPIKELADIAQDILINDGVTALQYGITEGYDPLRIIIGKRMEQLRVKKETDQLIIVSGAQQGIDLTAKIFLNEGDGIVVENPSFIGALNSFRAYNAKMYPVNVENDGMDVNELEKLLKNNRNIKLIYTIPTFQNPSGITMSLEKRKKILELANKYNVYIIEDNPYGVLRYSGEDVPTIKSLDNNGRVICIGSMSKLLSPGIRVGWVIAQPDIIKKIVIVKQVNDVHTNMLGQMIAAEFMTRYSLLEHVTKLCELYSKRRDAMLYSLDKYAPDFCQYTRPDGGLFIWCTLPSEYDTVEVMKECVKNKVAFVPGNTFMVDIDKKNSSFRLNYSTMSEEKIEQGIKTLGEVLRNV